MTEKSNAFLINDQYYGVNRLGEGGFGTVWKVYDFSLKNFVAIKELLPQYSESKFIEMFYKEALIAKHLIHDNIVRVQHFWQGTNGSFYILMDFVSGCDLQYLLKVCKQKNLTVPIELNVFMIGSALKAIYHANKQAKDPITCKPYGIVYRDFSPGNIMISFDGNVKVSDFGIAQTAEDMEQENRTRVITGKYAYMSPEQVRGDLNLDHRSDIFTAGIVLYEVMMGKPLFSGETADIKKQILDYKFNPADVPNQSLPQEIYEVLGKALAKNKEERYQSALEMFRDLCRLLKGKYSEELTVELAKFVTTALDDEFRQSSLTIEKIKATTLQDVKSMPGLRKITCRDFIPGTSAAAEPGSAQPRNTLQQRDQLSSPRPYGSPVGGEPMGEEKGKTVFEEVGDWIITNLQSYKRMVIRLMGAMLFAAVLLTVADTLLRITPVGKKIYARIYPPDAVIETSPPGAKVTMKTRAGAVIINNADSTEPIELRKVPPQSYIVEAVKDGFKPVHRVVTIEEKRSGGESLQQKISIIFYYVINVNSVPPGADIFINGNSMGKTPWKGELSAGEHTVKLAMPGYEDLGSTAKERKEGQCNIDFSRSDESTIFHGVDPLFWNYKIEKVEGISNYNISGYLFKKFNIDSNPKNITVHIESESKPRGNTPLTISLRAGDYKLRFIDSEGKYRESTQDLKVSPESSPDIFVTLPKWVTINVRCRSNIKETVHGTVRITGDGVNLTQQVSSEKALRVALLPKTYSLTFNGGEKFKPLTLNGINFNDRVTVTGELDYIETAVTIKVAEAVHDAPITGAFVWIDGKIAGNTNSQGLWDGKLKYGEHSIKIVAKGYYEQVIDKEFNAEKLMKIPFAMKPEEPEPLPVDDITTLPDEPDQPEAPTRIRQASSIRISTASYQQPSTPAAGIIITTPAKTNTAAPDFKKPLFSDDEDQPEVKQPSEEQVAPNTNVTVCPHCGTKYYDKRKRTFCINCGKPLK